MDKLKQLVSSIGSWYSMAIRQLTYITGLIAGFCLLAITLIVTMDVTLRYGFNAPTKWANEFSGYLAVLIIFLGIGYVLRENAHIRVDVFVRKLPRRVHDWLKVITSTAFLGYVIILFHLTWDVFVMNYMNKKTSFTAMDVVVWPVQIFIPAGLAIMGLLLIHHVFIEVKVALGKAERPEEEIHTGES